jgi:hypothetical protein
VVSPIQAVLTPAIYLTTYSVLVSDPDGDLMSHRWEVTAGRDCLYHSSSKRVSQGEFRLDWQHTPGVCHLNESNEPHPVHANTVISVIISDGTWTVTCTYTGVQSGTGPACSAPVRVEK